MRKEYRYNSFYRFISGILIILHLVTFGPIREVFAFSAESVNYKLSSGVLNSGGAVREKLNTKIWQDVIGESCIGKAESANYILNAGYIPTIQSNPPILKEDIPYQAWAIDSSKEKAFDLDDYFVSPEGYSLKYSVIGNSKINITIDPDTHEVSFSSAQGWSGVEKVYFIATDTEGNTVQSNEVVLQVASAAGELTNKPIIVNTELTPQNLKEGDLVTLVVQARDLDNQDLTFSYSDFFTETKHWQDGDYWYSESTWQVPAKAAGHYSVRVTATDPTKLTDTTNVIVNIGNSNHAPVLEAIPEITANEGDLVVINPKATDTDGDSITYYYSIPFDTQGKWLTNYEDEGDYDIRVSASDGIDTVSQNVRVTINKTNRSPRVNLTLSKYTVIPNQSFDINLTAIDPDNDAMTYVLKKDAQEIASGNLSGEYVTTVSFSDIGDHTITAVITDSGSLSTTQTKGVDVTEPNSNINPVMGDFNGDSLSDLGLHNSDTGTWEICISDAGVFRNAVDWLKGFGTSRDWWPIGGDFNGDSKTDIGVYNNTTGELKVGLSSGSSFIDSGTWFTPTSVATSGQSWTGNFNGDKYTDFAVYNKDTGEVRIALGTGAGFSAMTTWSTGFGSNYTAMSGDFNGDSLSDLCLFKKSTGEFKVAFSNTKEFVDGSTWISGFATDKDALISDFNNDGLTDVGYWDKSSSKWYYAISNGDKFVDKGLWLENFGSANDESVTTGDFNGDGITDAATFDKDQLGIQRWQVKISQNNPADLLTEIDNGIGGKTQIVYTYAAKTDNAGLPFPVYVASSISLINTFPSDRVASYTQNFTFSDGYFDAQEREFRGFGKVTVRDPLTNNYTETYFYQGKPFDSAQGKSGQDGALKGQIQKVIAYDGSTSLTTGGNSQKISETVNTYEVKKAGPEDNSLGFPALTETTSTVWEENGTSLSTKDKLTYDNIGNVIEQRNEGDASKTGDEKTAVTTYAQAYESGFNRPLETTLKDKDGNIISKKSFEYDNKGNLNKDTVYLIDSLIYNGQGMPCPYSYTNYTYDSFGNLTITTNALGSAVTTDYETDFYTYPEKVTNSLGQSISYEYDPKFGIVTKATDTNGSTSSTTYDSLARVLEVKNTYDQIVATCSYPDFNTKITTNAVGLFSTEYIDGIGRKYKTVSPGEDADTAHQVTSEVFYNNRGLTEKESLPHYINEDENQISYIKYEYDIRGRAKKTISDFPGISADAQSSIDYINPLYTETTDPLGHKKGALKDVYGNIVEVTEFTSDGIFKTKYDYDNQNNLIKTTDNQGNITQIFYDSIGRKIKMIDPDMGVWNYEYDILGNLIKQTDAKGQELIFKYDQLNRLIKKSTSEVAAGLLGGEDGITLVTYTYDDTAKDNCTGRLSKVEDQSGSTEFFYDKLGRETRSIKTVGYPAESGSVKTYEVKREYDILDRLIKLTYPDGAVVNYNYDINSGLLEKVADRACPVPTEYIKDIAYNAKGQIKAITYGNGVTTNYTYGQDLRLSRILSQSPVTSSQSPVLQDLNYNFDKNGNVQTLTDNIKNNVRSFIYDDLDRLKEANNLPSPSGGYTNYSYRYDSIGNMTYKSDIGVMNYGLNAGPDSSVGAGPHAVTNAGGYTYKYDASGNMIVGKNKTLTYDVENRLTSVDNGKQIESYLYDGDGGRVKKTMSLRGAVGDEACLPDRQAISTTYIGSLYETTDDTDNGSLRTRITKHIFAGANRVCSIESTVASGTVAAGFSLRYYHSDHLGSSNIITDADGKLVQHCEYTPYGSIAVNDGTDVAKHKFTGKELDSTGLYFYGARYYDPEIGRFITPDTIVQAPYDSQSLNRYAYCRNNPINYVDPSGHFFFAIIIAAVIGAAVGAGVAAATGGDIGKGAIMGAISGALFWGAGQAIGGLAAALKIQSTTVMIALKTGIHAFTGAASGALGAVATGGDVSFSAAIGGISAGMSACIGGMFPIPGDGLGAFLGRGIQQTTVGAILGGGTSLIMGGSFGEGASQGAMSSAIAYTCNQAMHETVEKVKFALITSKDKASLAPSDINQKNSGTCSSKVIAKFKWYDPTSWIFPGTNYCGITKSGPGQPTSTNDVCCQKHDVCVRNAKVSWWIPNYKMLDCHDELVDCIKGYTKPNSER